jgi:excisionase family DNA binding protein
MIETIRPRGAKRFMTTPPLDHFLKIQSVADTLSCSDDYVYMLIRNGNLQAIKIGERALRISDQSLQAFISARVVNPDDYFAPEEPPATEPQRPKATRSQKIARSKWMQKP